MPIYDIEYTTHIYITRRNIEAKSRDEAIAKADAQWVGNYPVVTEPSETAPWLNSDDIHISKDWEVNDVTSDNHDDEDDHGWTLDEAVLAESEPNDAETAWRDWYDSLDPRTLFSSEYSSMHTAFLAGYAQNK